MPSILCSNARAQVAQLVRASDLKSEDLDLNVFFHQEEFIVMQYFIPVGNSPYELTQLPVGEHVLRITPERSDCRRTISRDVPFQIE